MNDDSRLARFLDQQEIRDVYYRYCRGIDRRDYELVRRCYHPDAVDHHGEFVGGIDDFLEFVQSSLPQFDRTMHFLGNILIEVDGDRARGEAYVMAFHHMRATTSRPERDFVAWFRYVDDFERRDGEWRIACRVLVYDWTRMDVADPNPYRSADRALMARFGAEDAVFAPSLAALVDPE